MLYRNERVPGVVFAVGISMVNGAVYIRINTAFGQVPPSPLSIFWCWSATVGTCRTIFTRRRQFVSHLVLLDESIVSYAWMANKKGAGRIMTGTSVRVAV